MLLYINSSKSILFLALSFVAFPSPLPPPLPPTHLILRMKILRRKQLRAQMTGMKVNIGANVSIRDVK